MNLLERCLDVRHAAVAPIPEQHLRQLQAALLGIVDSVVAEPFTNVVDRERLQFLENHACHARVGSLKPRLQLPHETPTVQAEAQHTAQPRWFLGWIDELEKHDELLLTGGAPHRTPELVGVPINEVRGESPP